MIYEMLKLSYILNEEKGTVIQPELPIVSDGDIFICCNLARFETKKIFRGVKGLTFIDCNLINCELPSDSKISEDCNTASILYEVELV